MKKQVYTDMPLNELNDLLVSERQKLVKMKMSHSLFPLWKILCRLNILEKRWPE